MRRLRIVLCVAATVMAAMAAGAQLGKLLKGAGIGFAISKFGPDINKAINGLTRTPNETREYATRVVPIISVGNGQEVGGAQIMGPPAAVKRVVVVAQLEGGFSPIKMRIRALIPVASRSLSDIKRVPGVGISGLIDLRL